MKEFLYEFGNPKRRKKDVWVDVSKKMQLTDSLLVWTSEDCRKKWSNMIRTFKTIEEQRARDSNNGNKKVKWPFYEQMLELLSLEGADCFPEAASVLASSRELSSSSVNDNGSSQQEVYQNSGETSHDDMGQSSLDIEGIQNTEQGSQQAVVVEETEGTEQMQFYIVDNNPDGRSNGDDEGTTVTFTASTEDFQTLATVAAAAASASNANPIDSTASLSLSSSDLKTNTLKEVKFPDQIISVPSTSSPSLLAIPADISSATGLATVVSIPLARYAGQLQSIQPRPLQEPPTVSAMNASRSSEIVEINTGRSSSSLNPNSSSPVRGIRINPSPIRKSQGENAMKKRKISKYTHASKKLNQDSIGDPLLDKFLAISNKQSERILEKIETFQQETLQIMRERNKLLENIFEFLKSQASDAGHPSGHAQHTEPL